MAQGDAYVYDWNTGTGAYVILTLTPSAGVEWMFVSSLAASSFGSNDVTMILGTDTGTSANQVYIENYAGDDGTGRTAATGGPGWNTGNLKIIATNSSPQRWQKYQSGSAIYHAKFSAIVINE